MRIIRCDACGKEVQAGPRMWDDDAFISVESSEDNDCFQACSWSCVAQIALQKAAQNVETDL